MVWAMSFSLGVLKVPILPRLQTENAQTAQKWRYNKSNRKLIKVHVVLVRQEFFKFWNGMVVVLLPRMLVLIIWVKTH